MSTQAGFREIPHTADWALHVWGSDFASLFEQAAFGMNAIAGVTLADEPRLTKELVFSSMDPESLLVAFLSELLFLQEQENLSFDSFHLLVDNHHLQVHMEGGNIINLNKAIKAVTYHELKIQTVNNGFEANIVFDV